MAMIQLPDERAAALAAKAASQRLILQAGLEKLAQPDMPTGPRKRGYKLAELIAKCDLDAALSIEDHGWMNLALTGREAL